MSLSCAVPEVDQTVAELIVDEDQLPLRSAQAVLAFGRAAVPALIKIIDVGLTSDSWAPIHAAGLLGELRAPELVGLVVRALPLLEPGDLLINALLDAIGLLGRLAIDGLLAAAEATGDGDRHQLLLCTLAAIGIPDERVFQALVTATIECPVVFAPALARYGDRRALEPLTRLAHCLPEPTAQTAWRDCAVEEVTRAIRKLGGVVPPEAEELEERLDALRRRLASRLLFEHAGGLHAGDPRALAQLDRLQPDPGPPRAHHAWRGKAATRPRLAPRKRDR